MQSGKARTKEWFLEYEPEQPREIEPLMGWTASGDMRQQVRLRFDTAEEATAYCERHGIAYQVFNPKPDKPRIIPYADNCGEFGDWSDKPPNAPNHERRP